MEIKSFFGFENAVEKLAIKHYMANLVKGKEIIEHYIQELLNEGITQVPRFEENSPDQPSDVAHSRARDDQSSRQEEADEVNLPHHSTFGTTVSSSITADGRAHRGTSKKFYYLCACGMLAGCGLVIALR